MSRLGTIHLASAADAREIAEMSRDCVEAGLGWSWTPVRVLRAIRDRQTNVAVMRDGAGALLGFGMMQYGDERAHLSLLAVAPDSRTMGLGRELLGWLEKCAATAGVERITLEVRRDNPGACAFYGRCGYGEAGSVPNYYSGVIDATRFEKRLRAPTGSTPA